MPKLHSVREEIYSHEYLWRSASKLLEHAEAQEVPFHFLLPSLLMSFLAYEGFVNFCGFVARPELWEDEKKHFKGKGIEGKLASIVEKLRDFSWVKGKPPYQTIKKLEDFRDTVSHAKVIATKYVVERKDDGSQFRFKHPWDEYLTVDAVKRARADIKSFCDSLQSELHKHFEHLHLTFGAFEGSLATAESGPNNS